MNPADLLAGENGVINVALLSVIRRWHFRDGLSQREIARRTGLSRNTIRKYINSKVVEPSYPKRQTSKKLDEYDQLWCDWLRKESKKPRKQRKSVKLLHRELVSLGFSGSYDRVAAFVRLWREEQKFLTNKQAYVSTSPKLRLNRAGKFGGGFV
jgi:transposase